MCKYDVKASQNSYYVRAFHAKCYINASQIRGDVYCVCRGARITFSGWVKGNFDRPGLVKTEEFFLFVWSK